MVSELKHLRVLLASPSDVAAERDSAQRVVAELNRTLPAAVGVHLDLVAWETHATPALGTDPQAVLNDQLGEDYDVFVGILWSRIGTPTPRALSGTVEEFERAYARWQAAPDRVSAMFYFKEEGISPFDLDLEQLKAVQGFRAKLQETALTAAFKTTDEFEAHLRVHLTRQVFACVRSAKSSVLPEPAIRRQKVAPTPSLEDTDDGEEGLLDLVERSNDGFRAMNGSIARLTEETRAVGASMEDQAAAITDLDMTQPDQAKKAKQLVNRTAERLFGFSRSVDRELPQLHEAALDAIGSVGRAAQLAPDFGPAAAGHLAENLSALQQFRGAVSASRGHLAAWRQQVERMPRVTTRFNKAKRETLEVLGRIDKELAATETLGAETSRLIEEVLENFRAI